MNETEITFLSSRGRGLSNDLALVKEYLAKQSGKDVKFRYYLNNERHKNPLAAHGYRRAKKDFMEGITNVLCVDASLSTNINNLAPEGSRILYGVPYDYQFKNMFLMEEKGKEFNLNTFARFTHIIPGSPFTADLLKKAYWLEDKEIIEGVSLPFAYDVGDAKRREAVSELFYYYFPQARGKKILSVIVYGDVEAKRKDWEAIDVKQWVKDLGEEWFVFTNSDILMENAFSMGNHYKDSFGYVNRILPVPDLLYVSDVLVTNNGRLASVFAIQEKPVYVCRYNKNYFETYVSLQYPEMYFENAENMCETKYYSNECSKVQSLFNQRMSYGNKENVYHKTAELVGL